MGFMEITVYFPKLKLLHIDKLSTNYFVTSHYKLGLFNSQ